MKTALAVLLLAIVASAAAAPIKFPLLRRNVPRAAPTRHLTPSGIVETEIVNGTWLPLAPTTSVPLYNFPLQVGTPAKTFYVVPDSGSNYVGVASGEQQSSFRNQQHQFVPSESSTFRANTTLGKLFLSYGGGLIAGSTGYDTVSIGDATVTGQGMLLVEEAKGPSFTGPGVYFEGIVGLCFPGLYRNETNKVDGPGYFPTLVESMYNQGALDNPTFGFYLASNVGSDTAGEIQFGAPDTTRFSGELNFVDVLPMFPTRSGPAAYGFWLLQIGGVSVDGRMTGYCQKTQCYGFVDTGGPLLNIPLGVAKTLIPFVHVNSNCSGVNLNPTLSLHIGGVTYPLTPEDYVYRVPDPITGETRCELGINVGGELFQIGDTFLRKYYTYFVAGQGGFAQKPQLGFAPAVHSS